MPQEFNVDGRRSATYDDVPISGDNDHYEDPDSDMEENDSDQPHFKLYDANSTFSENSETARTTSSSENTETAFSENDRYRDEVTFKKELDRCNSSKTFSEKWNSVRNYFSFLLQFASGINAIMGGSHSVESDFSLPKFAKNDRKSQMTNIALEGQMQSKQFKLL